MAVPGSLTKITGSWTGQNQLWLTPQDPVQVRDTQAVVGLVAQGKFITIQYIWEVDGQPQEGLLVVGSKQDDGDASIYWIDSWHMNDDYMILKGPVTESGGITGLGSYPVSEYSDWGWRITVEPQENGKFTLLMYNITPDGQEIRAVEAVYTRTV